MTREEYIDFANALKNNYTIDFDKLPEFCDMAISALSKNKGEWIPVGKCGYPKPEDEYKRFLTTDNKGEITIQEFLLSLDKERQPYFTGMRNIVAWQPLPESYKGE